MIHSYFLAFILVLVSNQFCANADLIHNHCHVTVNNDKFDLSSLAGEQVVSRTHETPPTIMVDSLRFNVCADLKYQTELPEQDQCPSGTRACLTTTNKKVGKEDRIITVVPIAKTSTLAPKYYTSIPPTFISIFLNGPPLTSSSEPQTLRLTVQCDPDKTSDPKFISYDGSRVDVEWSSPAGCPSQREDDNDDDDKNDDKKQDDKVPNHERVGSGLGWFFLIIFLSLAAYFGVGAYYNYSTYGARGADLIPHRDFWKEVPYMLSDVVSHMCSNIRPRRASSRGGYQPIPGV